MRRVALALLLVACSRSPKGEVVRPPAKAAAQPAAPTKGMKISSPAFADGGEIPLRYGCSGSSVSPPLAFAGIVPGARSLALIVEDPDAPGGMFTHWVLWNVPPWTTFLPEGVHPPGTEGTSGYGKPGYGPPCPPAGEHRYVFRLFELDTALTLPADGRRDQLLEAMKGHVIAEARIMGRYRR